MNAVRTGADRIMEMEKKVFSGKRLGLLTNPTGIDASFRSTLDLIAALESAQLKALFACEHGIRGEKQAGVLFGDETDPVYGMPVFSLYGEHRRPTKMMLESVDAVVFDIQDLGVRFYTYLSTLVYLMKACSEHGKEVIVLDRPNPLGGIGSEGGFLDDAYQSMVGAWRVPFRTGLTIGEFARLVQGQMETPCRLEVVPLDGWKRSMEYPGTGLPWLMPSPNMPTMDTVRVYTGNCLFEGTNLSEGRGTTKPFELIGAPWLKARELCGTMNGLGLPGVVFHPVTFTPMFSKHQGALCEGIQTFVTDPAAYRAVTSSLHLLHHIINLHPEFQWLVPEQRENSKAKSFIDILSGNDRVRRELHDREKLAGILNDWDKDNRQWKEIRKPYLLYGEE